MIQKCPSQDTLRSDLLLSSPFFSTQDGSKNQQQIFLELSGSPKICFEIFQAATVMILINLLIPYLL
jgi:hypothetical protein